MSYTLWWKKSRPFNSAFLGYDLNFWNGALLLFSVCPIWLRSEIKVCNMIPCIMCYNTYIHDIIHIIHILTRSEIKLCNMILCKPRPIVFNFPFRRNQFLPKRHFLGGPTNLSELIFYFLDAFCAIGISLSLEKHIFAHFSFLVNGIKSKVGVLLIKMSGPLHDGRMV